MKTVFFAFRQSCQEVWRDRMLCCMLPLPLISAALLKLIIPFAEPWLCGYFHTTAFFTPYLSLLQLLVLCMTPLMFSYISVMTILDELDNGTARYLCVTPLGKSGYLAARILLPNLIAVIYSVLLGALLPLASLNGALLCLISLLASGNGAIISLFVISCAGNKVEGMALLKLSSLVLAGLPVPFFILGGVQYLAAPLPSFWLAKLAAGDGIWSVLPLVVFTFVWCWLFYRRFAARIV